MKFCKDCKWCEINVICGRDFSTCVNPIVKRNNKKYDEINIITGIKKEFPFFCQIERLFDRFLAWLNFDCGIRGKYWEKKEAKR